MKITHYIYALQDPFTEKIKYIGRTINPKERLYGHICEGRNFNTDKAQWIKSILDQGKIPMIKILEETIKEKSVKAEEKWMKKHKNTILNISKSGNGMMPTKSQNKDNYVGLKVEPELAIKLSELAKSDRRSLSDYIRGVLLDHVQTKEKQ